MIRMLRPVQAAQMVSTMGRKRFPKVQMVKVMRQMAKKMRRSCQLVADQLGWYMETVATISDANPKLTDRVMVQLPMSHVQPVMKAMTVLCFCATWNDQYDGPPEVGYRD